MVFMPSALCLLIVQGKRSHTLDHRQALCHHGVVFEDKRPGMPEDSFATLISDSRRFLDRLAQDNTREWFLAHKSAFDCDLKSPALALLDQVGAGLEKLTGRQVNTKLFRPNRDVRFSKDKTPYHLHLHMLWSTPPTGWFFGIGRDYLSVGAGIMGFDKEGLIRWRQAVDGTHGAEILREIDALMVSGARMDDAELKRVPAPYDKDHPRADLLKRKNCTVWFDFDEADFKKNGLVQTLEATFATLLPLNTRLAAI